MSEGPDLVRAYHAAQQRYLQELAQYRIYLGDPNAPPQEVLTLDAEAAQKLKRLGDEVEAARQAWLDSLWERFGLARARPSN